jgi:acyl transferase domain-containing protein/acyl carrier protein
MRASVGAGPGQGVAVIGMGCRFPGGADGLDSYWELLDGGRDAIAPVPDGRWAQGLRYYDGSSLVPGRTQTMNGGFLDDIAGWDAELFGVGPQEARRIDPQQRLIMEVAWRAIEDAGIGLGDFRSARAGVFAGVTDSQQFTRLEHQYDPPCVDDPYMAVGASVSMAAGRLAFFLDASGPALSVDTACSTSLVAVHLAIESLLRGECDLAIVAAASAVIHPESFVAAYQIGMLARDGRCRAFDRRADGFSVGEGAGAVLLERLEDAQRNRRRIRAVARGSAVNQNGRSDGITAPQRQAQADVIRQALARGAARPQDVVFVEAHGAGTVLGDAIELEALAEVFGPRPADQPLHVGAVKTNMGHLLVAAGMAGLIKTVLALGRRRIPPNINFASPNPILRRTPWLRPAGRPVDLDPGQRPLAGVSSFGWSGTNAHVVLEAPAPPVKTRSDNGPHVLTLAAASAGALRTLAAELACHLEQDRPELADVARTLQAGRSGHQVRGAVVAASADQAAAAFRNLAAQPQSPAGLRGGARVGLLLPGAGPAGPGTAARLAEAFGSFRAAADECRRAFRAAGLDLPAAPPRPGAPSAQGRAAADALAFTLGYAVAAVLREAGVRPAGIYGEGASEYLAACLAGVFSVEHAARILVARARLAEPAGAGGSAAGGQPSAQTAALDQLRQAIASAPCQRPAVPLISAVSGTWIDAGTAQVPDYWARPPGPPPPRGVAVGTLASGVDVIAEAGAGLLNGAAVAPGPGGPGGAAIVGLLARETDAHHDSRAALLEGIARIWEAGAAVAWPRIGGAGGQIVSLPPHPFERRAFWPSSPGAAPGHADDSTRAAQAGQGGRSLHCYTRTWHQAVTAAPAGTRPGTVVLISADAGPGAALAGPLRAAGWQVHLCPAGESAAGRAALLDRAAAQAADRAGLQVIDCSALGAAQPGAGDAVGAFSGLMRTCQALSRSAAGREAALLAAVSGTVEVVGGDAGSVAGGACAGLMSALGAEYPWLRCRVVDLDPAAVAAGPGAADVLAGQVLDEAGSLASGSASAEWPSDGSLVAWRNGRRWVPEWTPTEIPPGPAPWRPDGVYVITGGTRGLGMALARHIARAGRPRLVLVGRTQLPPRSRWDAVLDGSAPASGRVRATLGDIREIERQGAEVIVLSADVADPDQMRGVLRTAAERCGAVHGVVHCAGIPGGGLLDRKTAGDAAAVIGAKAGALAPLSEAVQAGGLDLVVLYSSAVTALGGLGETDYAAANACLEAFASASSGSGTRVLAVAWGPWQHDDWQQGALTGLPGLARATRGYRSEFGITADSGTALLDRLLGARPPSVLVLTEPLDEARQRWAALADLDVIAARAGDGRQPRPDLLAPYIPPGTPLQASIADLWQQYLGLDQVGIDDPFFDLGGNSLVGVSMVRRLERELGLTLPPSLLFERPTVRELAAALDEEHHAGQRPPAPQDEPGLRRQLRATAVQARRRELQTRKEGNT